MARDPLKSFPTAKTLSATIEVVIYKRSTDAEAKNFITQTLLNYNPNTRNPQDPGKPCVIKNKQWELQQGAVTSRWSLDQVATDLVWPQPKVYNSELKPDEAGEKNYWRYILLLELPVSEDARKPKPPAPAAPAENK